MINLHKYTQENYGLDVTGTLNHRAKTVCTRPEHFKKELQHLREALVRFKYPNWAISRVQNKYINNNWEGDINHNNLQALTKHSTPGITPTFYKTTTIQTQAQKNSPLQGKNQD